MPRICSNLRCRDKKAETFYVSLIGDVSIRLEGVAHTGPRLVQVLLCEPCARGVWRPEHIAFNYNEALLVDIDHLMAKPKKTNAKTLSAHLRAFADELDNNGGASAELAKWFNDKMDELLEEDFFGTEGQCDPRGDHRD